MERKIAGIQKGEVVHVQFNAKGDGSKGAEDLLVEFLEVTGNQHNGRNLNVVVEEVDMGQRTGRRLSVGGGVRIK